MRRAARLGDGWMPYLYSPRRYAASVETIRAVAADAGRDLSDFGWYAWIFVNVDADGDRARDGAARTMGGSYRQDFTQMVDSVAAAGTPAEVQQKLEAFVEAGARHFILHAGGRPRRRSRPHRARPGRRGHPGRASIGPHTLTGCSPSIVSILLRTERNPHRRLRSTARSKDTA